ncbi:penicillin-binding protein activator, partial [Rhizobiaceae bacterium]|nr:penicillin-binding protein activator [Rhizobiaceae bacterium]
MLRSTLILLLCTLPNAPFAAERVGLVLPLSGPEAPVAQRVEFGAQQAAERMGDAGSPVTLTLVDDDCEAEGTEAAVTRLREAEVEIVVGPICNATAEALARAMPEVPVISLDTRNPLLKRRRDVDALALFELGSAPEAEAAAMVEQAIPAFDGKPWALIDDGGLAARSLSDAVRLLVEETSARPVEFANFRPLQRTQKPLLRRLNRSG